MVYIALALGISVSSPGKDARLDRLSPELRKWLEEEVVYIIAEGEREVFLSLQTLEERERFIEAFWRRRDPNSTTPGNEFKEEHHRRLEHANKFLGRDSVRPGWRTDRGRIYIILGEPREVERFDGYDELVSTELWFYEGDPARGLPAFFYVLFFRRHGVGEYQIYHPVSDGPSALLRSYLPSDDIGQALDILRQFSPELARASLSLDTSDPPDFVSGRASLGTDTMMARIEESPRRAVRTDYADAWLRYGKKVSADYSFNFVPSRSYFAALAGPRATPFVHYSVELDPENFALETDEDRTKFYTTLDISLEARDVHGNLVVADDKERYLELTPSEFQQFAASPFAYQDDFPLLPGRYTVSVVLRNRVLKQYTAAEQEMEVESLSSDKPGLSDIVLGYRSELAGSDAKPEELRTFQVGRFQIYPASESVFSLGETVHAFFQVVGADSEFGLRFALLHGRESLQERFAHVGDYEGAPILERFQLTNMVGGNYELRVQLLNPSGTVVAERFAALQVSPRTAIARPNSIVRLSFNTRVAGLLALCRGEQFLALKQYEEARRELENAVAANNPKLPEAKWRLAEALIHSGEGDRVLSLLAPLENDLPNQFEVVAGLGFAHYLKGDFPNAVRYLERCMKIRPPDTSLLNALGDSYHQLGFPEKAKEVFRRSLELDPEQRMAKERLAAIEKSH